MKEPVQPARPSGTSPSSRSSMSPRLSRVRRLSSAQKNKLQKKNSTRGKRAARQEHVGPGSRRRDEHKSLLLKRPDEALIAHWHSTAAFHEALESHKKAFQEKKKERLEREGDGGGEGEGGDEDGNENGEHEEERDEERKKEGGWDLSGLVRERAANVMDSHWRHQHAAIMRTISVFEVKHDVPAEANIAVDCTILNQWPDDGKTKEIRQSKKWSDWWSDHTRTISFSLRQDREEQKLWVAIDEEVPEGHFVSVQMKWAVQKEEKIIKSAEYYARLKKSVTKRSVWCCSRDERVAFESSKQEAILNGAVTGYAEGAYSILPDSEYVAKRRNPTRKVEEARVSPVDRPMFPMARITYKLGQRICVFRHQQLVDFHVGECEAPQHNCYKLNPVNYQDEESTLVSLNRTNHLPSNALPGQQYNTHRYTAVVQRTNEYVTDAITLRKLKTSEQLVRLSIRTVSPAGSTDGSGLAIKNVEDLAKYCLGLTETNRFAMAVAAGNIRYASYFAQIPTRKPVLIRAGAGSGKTWLTKQLLWYLCDNSKQSGRVPFLLPIQVIAKAIKRSVAAISSVMQRWLSERGRGDQLAEDSATAQTGRKFEITINWLIEVMVQRVVDKTYHRDLLQRAFATRSVIIILDGLDEAAELRAPVIDFITDTLVSGGHQIICTSRPEGIDDTQMTRFDQFIQLDLEPLSQEQQREVIRQQCYSSPFFKYLFRFIQQRSRMDQIYDREFPEPVKRTIEQLEPVKGNSTQYTKSGEKVKTQAELYAAAKEAKVVFDGALAEIMRTLEMDPARVCHEQDGHKYRALSLAPLKGTGRGVSRATGELQRLVYRIVQKANEEHIAEEVITLDSMTEFAGETLKEHEIQRLRMNGKPLNIDTEMRGLDDVKDIVRASILCEQGTQLLEVVEAIEAHSSLEIVKLKNFFQKLGPTHYRRLGLNVRVRCRSGGSHVAELQVHHQSVQREQPDHEVYEYFRGLISHSFDSTMGSLLQLDEKLGILEEVVKVPVLLSLLIVADVETSRLLPGSTAELYEAAIGRILESRCGETGNVATGLEVLKQVSAYVHLCNPRDRVFGTQHVKEALVSRPFSADEDGEFWFTFANSPGGIPCFKTLSIDSACEAYQALHLSLQEYLSARFFYEFVADPEHIRMKVLVSEFRRDIPRSKLDIFSWHKDRQIQAEILADTSFAGGSDNFFRFLFQFPGVCDILFPSGSVVFHDTPLSEKAAERLGQMLCSPSSVRSLDFGHTDMSAIGARNIATGLSKCQSLTSLDLSGNLLTCGKQKGGGLGKEAITALAQSLSKCPALASINLADNQLWTEGAEAMAAVLPKCKALTSLNLAGNKIQNEGAKAVTRALPKCELLKTLTFSGDSDDAKAVTLAASEPEADVSDMNIGTSGAIIAAAFLPRMEALTAVNLAGNGIEIEGAEAVAAALLKCRKLISFIFPGDFYYDGGWKDAPAVTLEASDLRIDVSNHQHLGLSGAIMAASFLPKMEVLIMLSLCGNEIGGKQSEPGVNALAKGLNGNKTIQELNLSKNKLDAECAQILAPVLKSMTALTSVNLAGNKIGQRMTGIGAEGAEAVAAALPKCRKLISFTFSGDSYYDGGWKDAPAVTLEASDLRIDVSNQHLGLSGAIMAASFLPKMEVLIMLSLCGNEIGGKQSEPGVNALAKGLNGNKTIQELNLSKNKLDAECAQILAPVLKSMTALLSVDLSANSLLRVKQTVDYSFEYEDGMGGIIALAQSFPQCPALASINLANNQIGQRMDGQNVSHDDTTGIVALAAAFPQCPTLTSLNIAGNDIKVKGANVIAVALRKCWSLASFTFSGDSHASEPATLKSSKTDVDISNKMLGASGAIMAAAFLSTMDELTAVNLAGNDIKAKGAEAVAVVLPKCEKLESVNLSNNNIGADGAKALAGVLQKCKLLTSVNLASNCSMMIHYEERFVRAQEVERCLQKKKAKELEAKRRMQARQERTNDSSVDLESRVIVLEDEVEKLWQRYHARSQSSPFTSPATHTQHYTSKRAEKRFKRRPMPRSVNKY